MPTKSHIAEICTMCFLLNGRNRRKSNEYSCGFFPKKIHTMAHGKPGRPGIDIEFNGIEVYLTNRVHIVINSKSIWVSDDGKEFIDTSSKQNAQSIFGKNANPNIVMIEAKWALAEILNDFKAEIEDTLARRHDFRI